MIVKLSLKKFINLLIWASILTSSFDIVLVFDIAGYTFRASQLLMMLVMLFFAIDIIKGEKILIPAGYMSICLCALINLFFIFNSKSIVNALNYAIWFVFVVVQLLVMLNYLVRQETMESIIRKYIYCFTFMSGIGLVQFVLQFFDISFFVTLYTDMHRCNGFSFEPSYYSTYLLMGWTICMYLLEKSNNTIISTRKLVIFTTIITLALVTSTSRMGWMMMGVYIVFRAIIILFTRMNSKLSVWECLILLVAAVGIVFVAWGLYSALSGNTKILKYLNGLGIAGMSSHSISFRLRSQIETFEVFKNSPVIGCSLGGVDPEICYNRNIKYNNRLNGISGNIFAEILAGTGIVGFLFFVRFLYVITCQKYKKVKNSISKHKKEILVAVIFALIMEITILQMNQNILRQPLWIHISIVCSLYYLAEKQKAQ